MYPENFWSRKLHFLHFDSTVEQNLHDLAEGHRELYLDFEYKKSAVEFRVQKGHPRVVTLRYITAPSVKTCLITHFSIARMIFGQMVTLHLSQSQ